MNRIPNHERHCVHFWIISNTMAAVITTFAASSSQGCAPLVPAATRSRRPAIGNIRLISFRETYIRTSCSKGRINICTAFEFIHRIAFVPILRVFRASDVTSMPQAMQKGNTP
jgi:hypothetical protein